MNYQEKINKVTQFIGQHLDEKLTLEQLSEIACLSRYHFHRLFTALTGLPLHQYIRWLRLKRAAHQLCIDKKQAIINIAVEAGFDSHEAFCRAFKKTCGLSPSDFRNKLDWSTWEKPPYRLQKQGKEKMNVEINSEPEIRLAIIEHRGDPSKIAQSVDKLIQWAKSQNMNLKPKGGDSFAIAYDDPKTTPAEEFRLDLGIKIPESITLSGDIKEMRLPAGRYAKAIHRGSRDSIGDTVYSLYRDWLPESGEELSDLPCIFCYLNFDHEVAETELLTECRLLLS